MTREIGPGQSGVGGPGMLRLEVFGELLWDAFDAMPYLVGSAAGSKTWRDVDVRVILPDRIHRLVFLAGHPSGMSAAHFAHTRWGVVCMAFSALGREMTGLPIDFQVQSQAEANAYDGPRIPIGLAHVIENGTEPGEVPA